jgi:hypothetical protein
MCGIPADSAFHSQASRILTLPAAATILGQFDRYGRQIRRNSYRRALDRILTADGVDLN